MRKRIRHSVLCVVFLGITFGVQAQYLQNHPPEPKMSTEDSSLQSPCGSEDGGGQGPGIPPPVGLCLPINDYLPALLLLGIGLGSFTLWKMGKISKEEELPAIEQ